MGGKTKYTITFKVVIILVFTLFLILCRLIWVNNYSYSKDSPKAIDGELDLRNWDLGESGVINLSGEWEFFPYELLKTDPSNYPKSDGNKIQVPSNWASVLNDDDKNPYGYGTYRLRIYVNDDLEEPLLIRIPSVRSASALYVNGRLVGHSGIVAKTEADYLARNLPYTSSSIYLDGDEIIDIYLQAANYVDPRASGLIRSVRFGYETDMLQEIQWSTLLQTLAGTIFLIYALFSLLIYFVGLKDKRLLYFSLAIFTLAIINLSGGDEKVLNQYLALEYKVQLKSMAIVLTIFAWALLFSVSNHLGKWSREILRTFTIGYLALILLVIFMPIHWLPSVTLVGLLAFSSALILSVAALLGSIRKYGSNIWIVLSVIAIINHFAWWSITVLTGLKVVYYPFDLIIAIICLTIVWLRHYYLLHKNTVIYADKLSEVDRMKDEFLVNVSHELRNPLHGILNLSEAVLNREEASMQKESKKNLNTVLTVSRRMSIMLDELLDMVALKDGTPKVKFSAISVQTVADSVLEMLVYSVKNKQINFENKIDDQFPPVYGDAIRLTQILFNLMHNAVKYTNEGEIIISAKTNGNYAYISVSDTGIGMSEKATKEIFKPYVQGENVNAIGEGGFGIGLYISKQLVELHGGAMFVTSDIGKGSTFTFSLPLANDHQLKSDSIESEPKAVPLPIKQEGPIIESVYQDKPRVLVVDDDPVNNQVIETVLGNEHYAITAVVSPKKVLDLLDEQEWDLIIADVMMPEMSGYELTEKIRERFTVTELPILLVTARRSSEDIESGFNAGANDYVTKPIDRVELQSRVFALTNVKKSLRKQLQMEAAWLQAQIKPHFLFNTLNSIIALSHIDIDRMGHLLNAFSDVLRAKFNFENLNVLIPIENELTVIDSYLHIERERFGERLDIRWEVDETINIMIPTLSIQPLVENAVNHGVMARNEGGTIRLTVTSDDVFAYITVEDDGVGMDEEMLERLRGGEFGDETGVGLINIDLRLKRLYGQGLKLESEPGKGTVVSFKVPYLNVHEGFK